MSLFLLAFSPIYISTPINTVTVPILAQAAPSGEGAELNQDDIPYAPQIDEPIPVSQTPTPDSIAAYGIQGVIISFIFTFGRPLAEKVYLFFNDRAKSRRDKEDKALDAQLNSASTQQTFLQSFMVQQQEQMNATVNTMLNAQKDELTKILGAMVNQTAKLESLLAAPLKIQDITSDQLMDTINRQTTQIVEKLDYVHVHVVTLPAHPPNTSTPTYPAALSTPISKNTLFPQ